MLKIGPFFNFWPYLAFSDFRAPQGPWKSDYAQISLKNLFFCVFLNMQKYQKIGLKKIWDGPPPPLKQLQHKLPMDYLAV